jgi:[ribosomal protein S5]-alanine N-acetyltransferase
VRIQIGDYQIRSYRPADAEAIVRHADNPRVVANLTDAFPHPYTFDKAREWLDMAVNQEVEALFAVADDHELVGAIGLHLEQDVFYRTAEIGYWLGETCWGRGIASAAVDAFTAYTFENFEDIVRIQAHVFANNPASARVLEKAGYDLEGRLRSSVFKNGELLDQWMYAKLR